MSARAEALLPLVVSSRISVQVYGVELYVKLGRVVFTGVRTASRL